MRREDKITTLDMEIALMQFFNIRKHLIVPNVSWGLMNHECDLLILRKTGYAIEVEIKVSKSDLLAEEKKKHDHWSPKIKELYFAVPYYMKEFALENIPNIAGLVIVGSERNKHYPVVVERTPISNNDARPFSEIERYKLARLGTLRILGMKKKIQKLNEKVFYKRTNKGIN